MKILCVIAVALLPISGCRSPAMGPCEHTVKESILHITAVTNASTGTPLSTFELSNLTVDGNPVDFADLAHDPAYGFTVTSGVATCTGSCGFGTGPGTYTFTVGASGHNSRVVTVKGVDYAKKVYGCPSYYNEGRRLSVKLVSTL